MERTPRHDAMPFVRRLFAAALAVASLAAAVEIASAQDADGRTLVIETVDPSGALLAGSCASYSLPDDGGQRSHL